MDAIYDALSDQSLRSVDVVKTKARERKEKAASKMQTGVVVVVQPL